MTGLFITVRIHLTDNFRGWHVLCQVFEDATSFCIEPKEVASSKTSRYEAKVGTTDTERAEMESVPYRSIRVLKKVKYDQWSDDMVSTLTGVKSNVFSIIKRIKRTWALFHCNICSRLLFFTCKIIWPSSHSHIHSIYVLGIYSHCKWIPKRRQRRNEYRNRQNMSPLKDLWPFPIKAE